MDQQQTVADIEHRAWEERVSINFLCQKAGIYPSTFWRWKKTEKNPDPVEPNMASIRKLYSALDTIAAENKRRRKLRDQQGKAVAA